MKDIAITTGVSGTIPFTVQGKTTSDGLMLYQQLLILLLSYSKGNYRTAAGTALAGLLQGANTPAASVMQQIAKIACSQALAQLDSQDRLKIATFSAAVTTQGRLNITLTLVSGTTYTGQAV